MTWPTELTGPAGACLDEARNFRTLLWRRWSDAAPLVFVMLNPSTADASKDDPTIRKCIGFAQRHGFGGIIVVNLVPYRATDPAELNRAHAAAQQAGLSQVVEGFAHNMRAFQIALRGSVVFAWGGNYKPWMRATRERVLHLCPDALCLGLTQGGHPCHPLMLAYTTPLVRFADAIAARAPEVAP